MNKEMDSINGFTLNGVFLRFGEYDHRCDFSGDSFCYGIYTIKEEFLSGYDKGVHIWEFKSKQEFIDSYPYPEKAMAVMSMYGVK